MRLMSTIGRLIAFRFLFNTFWAECSPLEHRSETLHTHDSSISSSPFQFERRDVSTSETVRSNDPGFFNRNTPSKRGLSDSSTVDDVFALPRYRSAVASSQSSETENLELQSSLSQITGIYDTTLLALPILSSDLTELLEAASADLSKNDPSAISFYQSRTTHWSFSIVSPENPLSYTTIQAIVHHYASLAQQHPASKSAIVQTRVGVVRKANRPVADVVILPLYTETAPNVAYVPFSDETAAGQNEAPSGSSSIEVMTITPDNSAISHKLVNPAQILNTFASSPKPAQRRSIAARATTKSLDIHHHQHDRRNLPPEIVLPILNTAFTLAIRVWQNQGGNAARVTRAIFVGIVMLAIMQIALGALKSSVMHLLGHDQYGLWTEARVDEYYGFDSGFLFVGGLCARIVMASVRRGPDGGLLALSGDVWRAALGELLEGFGGGERGGGGGGAYGLEGFIHRGGVRYAQWEVGFFPFTGF